MTFIAWPNLSMKNMFISLGGSFESGLTALICIYPGFSMQLFGAHVFWTSSDLRLNCVWLSEAERLRDRKLKWAICICVLFEACRKSSHSGSTVNSLTHLSSLIYLGIRPCSFSDYRAALEAHSLTICVSRMLVTAIQVMDLGHNAYLQNDDHSFVLRSLVCFSTTFAEVKAVY